MTAKPTVVRQMLQIEMLLLNGEAERQEFEWLMSVITLENGCVS